MNAQGQCMPGGPITATHIPLPLARPTGTDAITLYNQRPQRAAAPTVPRIRLARTQPDQEKP